MVDDAVRRDRRTELKEQHRDALVAAAADLLAERGGPGFSVDELAERADVARRTVFNHFASLDELAVEVGVRELEALVAAYDATVAQHPDAGADPLDELAATLHRMDLVPAMARLTRMFAPDSASGRVLLERALAVFTPRLMDEARHRAPEADPLDSELLVAQLTSGLVVLQRHWAERTGAAVSARSRAVWAELVDTLIDRMRSGHPSPSIPSPEHAHG